MYKVYSVLQTFVFESTRFLQSIEFAMHRTLKVVGSHQKAGVDFAVHHSFKEECSINWYWGHIWMCAPYFERVLHGEIGAKFKC